MKCPEKDCEGTIEANPKLYLGVEDDGAVVVNGIGYEDMILSCDDNDHELDPELHRDFYRKVQSSVAALESFHLCGVAL